MDPSIWPCSNFFWTGKNQNLNSYSSNFYYLIKHFDLKLNCINRSIKNSACQYLDINWCPYTLIADGAGAISNGFSSIFKLEKRITCWAHISRKIDAKLRTINDKNDRKSIRFDIDRIQILISEFLFNQAVKLFEKKWESKKSTQISNFLKYFIKRYGKKHVGWYEGFSAGIPSASNALESTHKQMKDHPGLTTKKTLRHFLGNISSGLLDMWSNRYNPNENPSVCNFK